MNKLPTIVKGLKRHALTRLKEDGRRICFCHVPKCGGVSVRGSISRQLYTFWERRLFPAFSIDIRASGRSARALGKSMSDIREEVLAYVLSTDDHRMAAGHVICRPALVKEYGTEWQFVTVLRDPVKRWLSEYVYNTFKSSDWAKNSLPIEQYLESPTGRASGVTFLRYFSSMPDSDIVKSMDYVEEAADNLARFAVVGFLEDLDGFSRNIHAKFGRQIRIPVFNVTPSSAIKKELTGNVMVMDRIREICEADSLVYQRIRQRVISQA